MVPSRHFDQSLKAHVDALTATYRLFGESVPHIDIYSENNDQAGNIEFDSSGIKVVQSASNPFLKLVEAASNLPNARYIVFSTADDITYFSHHDVEKMQRANAKVGVGHFLLCRPTNKGRFRIFRGWTHFQEYMGATPSLLRFNKYISEGPHTVWACYERNYLVSLAEMVSCIMETVDKQNVNLVEDSINLVNLLVRDLHCEGSVSLRFLEGNYGERPHFVPSWQAIKNERISARLPKICMAIKDHLRRSNAADSSVTVLSLAEIAQALESHSNGYRMARSRKWREWIDVDWRPFEAGLSGIAPSKDFENPYLNSYVLTSSSGINEIFPGNCWLSNKKIVNFFNAVPLGVWQIHSSGGVQ